jgi:hypothetical protein
VVSSFHAAMVFVYSSLISIEVVIYGEEIKENTLGQFQQNADKGWEN